MSVLKVGLSIVLCIVVSLESTLVKWVKLNQTIDPPSEHLVILAEITKGIICTILYKLTRDFTSDLPMVDDEHRPLYPSLPSSPIPPHNTNNRPRYDSAMYFMLPAMLYTISNNITFIALSYLSSSMFSLLMNLKIPMTGVLAYILLRKQITQLGWIALVTMFIGSAIACLRFQGTSLGLNCSLLGVILMVGYSVCSASAAVYMEYITRHLFSNENIFLQNIKFCAYGIVFNTIVTILRGNLLTWYLESIHLLSIFAMVFNGLITAAVIKYAGSIPKTYSVAFAALVTSLLALFIWHTILDWNYYLGAIICCLSIQLYVLDKLRPSHPLTTTWLDQTVESVRRL